MEGLSRSQKMPRVGHHLIFLVLFDELREGGGVRNSLGVVDIG